LGRAGALRLALALVIVLGVSACGDDSGNKPGTATPGAAQATPIPRPDPKTLLDDAANNLEQASSFHFVLEHERGTTPINLGLAVLQMTRTEGDVVRPDRLRADVTAQLGGQKVNLRLVSVGDNTKI